MLQRAARRVVAASPGRHRPVVKVLAIDCNSHALGGFVDLDQKLSVGGLTKKGQHRDGSGGQRRDETIDAQDKYSVTDQLKL